MTDRELDVLVAEKVMGLALRGAAPAGFYDGEWCVFTPDDAMGESPAQPVHAVMVGDVECLEVVPFYSTSIAAAWLVVAALGDDGLTMILTRGAQGNDVAAMFANVAATDFRVSDLIYNSATYLRREALTLRAVSERYPRLRPEMVAAVAEACVKGEAQQRAGGEARAICLAAVMACGVSK